GRVSNVVRISDQCQGCGIGLWTDSRIRTGDEAAGVQSIARRTGAEHDRVQRRGRDRTAYRADRASLRNDAMARPRRVREARGICQRPADDGRFPVDGISNVGIRIRERGMNPVGVQMPSAGGLLLRLGIAALVGAVLTVCVIMPAEYRKDPTGFGKLTGLIALATPTVARPTADAATTDAKTDAKATTTPALTTNAWFYPNEFRT